MNRERGYDFFFLVGKEGKTFIYGEGRRCLLFLGSFPGFSGISPKVYTIIFL